VLHATGLQTVADASETEHALSGDLLFFVKVYCPVRATVFTELTARTLILIDYDNAVFPLLDGTNRTKIGADRVVALDANGGNNVQVQFIMNIPWPD